MKLIQTRYKPHKRARIRAFFFDGIDRLDLPSAVEALPVLLHLSLFLFFAGLAVFLFNINHTVFKVAISWIGVCTGVYICITFMPIFWHDSPYSAPLSPWAWYLFNGIRFALFGILRWIASPCSPTHPIREGAHVLQLAYWDRISRGMEKEFEEIALEAPSRIDGRALMWTCESLDEDHELERFFSGIPGFCNSKEVDNSPASLDSLNTPMLAWTLCGFLERTFLSNLVAEEIKIRRLVICVRAIDAARLSYAANEIFGRFFQARPRLLHSEELALSLISWDNNDNWKTSLFALGILVCINANISYRRNDSSVELRKYLGISTGYAHDSNDAKLANLLHFARHFVRAPLWDYWKRFPVSHILSRLLGSDYNFRYTQPELQHDFCGLWNDIVRSDSYQSLLRFLSDDHRQVLDVFQHSRNHPLSNLLQVIHPIYVSLHEDFTPDDLYRLCSTHGHHIASTSNLNEMVEMAVPAPITITPSALHHHDSIPSIIPPATEYDASPPTSNLDRAIPHPVDEQSRNGVLDVISPVASPFGLAPLENDPISDSTTADPIQGTTDPSTISSMVHTDSHSTSSHGTASRSTRNMATTTPSFVPDTLPSQIPLLTISPDPAAPHISVDPTVHQSGRPPEGGPISHTSSQIFAPFPPTPQGISGFDSNAATEIGPLDAPYDTLDPNHRVMSQSFTPSSPDVAEYSLRPEDGDPSETSGPSH